MGYEKLKGCFGRLDDDNTDRDRVYKLQLGDIIYLSADVLNAKHGFKVVKMHYAPKKWWQFWKKKKLTGCEVMFI